MKHSERIRAQRQAVLDGHWVKHEPRTANEACLVVHGYLDGVVRNLQLHTHAWKYVTRALDELHPHWRYDTKWETGKVGVMAWNDSVCPSASVALDVLERAEKYAVIDEAR